MRTARLVGLSPDGRSLIVATETGEELAVSADERLRAAVRGDRPRLGQLEIEMDSALSPRDIQARIRAGASLEDVTRAAGVPMERVERFAAPVLAEREHVAGQAIAASVRRRGETSGHRSLRSTVSERLLSRGIDVDDVSWDSFRQEDGRWTVTADYRSGEAERHAEFCYDVRARFSVAENDEARWLIGEQSSARGPQPGRRRSGEHGSTDDAEPTLDLSDELALVRATREDPVDEPRGEAAEPTVAVPRLLHPVPDPDAAPVAADDPEPGGDEERAAEAGAVGATSPIETLYEMLSGDGYEEDSARVYAGLSEVPAGDPEPHLPAADVAGVSDASAVPETPPVAGWEPAIVVNYPVEPGDESAGAGGRGPGAGEDAERAVELPGTDEPAPPDPTVNLSDRTEEDREFELEHDQPPAPPARPARRKRASVPSWDEIMFGGPKRPT